MSKYKTYKITSVVFNELSRMFEEQKFEKSQIKTDAGELIRYEGKDSIHIFILYPDLDVIVWGTSVEDISTYAFNSGF